MGKEIIVEIANVLGENVKGHVKIIAFGTIASKVRDSQYGKKYFFILFLILPFATNFKYLFPLFNSNHCHVVS